MKSFLKFLFFIFVFVSLFAIPYSLFTIHAANAIPDPMVPCDEEEYEDPEFNSLRPYQASPCGDSKKTFYCSNDYVIEEKVTTSWKAGCDFENMTCPYTGPVIKRNYEIYMNDVKLPILGNTQNVANSETGQDGFDDAQKMNEYLSWYLTGATQKAEYGADSLDKTINYSGPVKKLTPQSIQDFQRFSVLHDAGAKENFTLEAEGEADPAKVKETSNHNQIAVCTTKNIFGIDNPWIGTEKPTPCYDGNGKDANGKKYRLVEWWGGKYADYLDSFKIIADWNPLTRWSYTIPPFPWQFEKEVYYQKAYQEWKGKECIFIPIVDKLVGCVDIKIPGVLELHTNVWADFYQYIPLGVTADKAGGHSISGVGIQGQGKTVAGRPRTASGDAEQGTYFIEQNPILYYPHVQSTYEVINNFNKVQNPQDSEGAEASTPTDYEVAACEILDVRSNEGDDLTFDNKIIRDKQKVEIRDVQIEITQVGCQNEGEIKSYFEKCTALSATATGGVANPTTVTGTATAGTATSGSLGSTTCNRPPSCDGVVMVTIPSTPKIPYADDLWSKTVVGQDSAFRRIFPKVGEGAPVSCIADIAGVSKVNYTPNGQTNLTKIKTPDGDKSPSDAQLFFPHLGTVYEYFLKGIQTALRPQGYGEPITNGAMCQTISCGEWESKLVDSAGACGICNAPIGDLAKKILATAGTAYNVPASNIWAAMLHEGGDWSDFSGFTDENVKKWSTSEACGGEPMPKCDNNADLTQPPFGFLKNWFYVGEGDNAIWSAVQAIDPSRNSPELVSRCNFLDAAFAAAKALRQGSSNTIASPVCGAYTFDTTQPASCSWSDTKIAQSQVGYLGQCPETSPYESLPFKIADVVGWEKNSRCK